MGSGCTNSNSSRSKGCFEIISSNCVSFQGDSVSSLDICQNDTLTEVLDAILDRLVQITGGTDIELNITNVCTAVQNNLQSGDTTLESYIQALVDTICEIQEEVTTLQNSSNAPETYSLVCLTGSSSLSSRQQVIQELIDQLCALKDEVELISGQITNNLNTTIQNTAGNQLLNAISSCGNNGIVKSGTGASAAIQFTAMVPLYVPVPYIGPLSWFDSNGVGLSQYGMCGWYIMNGLNGTQNWMGYGFSGATVLPGINSTALDSRVSGASDGANIGDKKGEVKHALTISELASHTHEVNQTSHNHDVTVYSPTASAGSLPAIAGANAASGASNTISTTSDNAPFSIQNTGSGTAHENRQPTVYGVWIIRLP